MRAASKAAGRRVATEGAEEPRRGRRSSIAIQSGGGISRPLKTAEAVARDVVHDIIVAGLQPGDGLPGEAAMVERYKVSRESLREGLRLLEVQGLISIRRGPGGGPVVGTVDPANLGRIATLYYHMAGATYSELFEAWVFAEATLADRAARHPDLTLRKAVMSPYLLDAPAPERAEEFVLAHAEFHAAVASLSRNRVLELSLQTMGLIVSHHVLSTYDPRILRERMTHEHHEIAVAIIAGHSSRAYALMTDHIEAVAELNNDYMGSKVDEFIEWH